MEQLEALKQRHAKGLDYNAADEDVKNVSNAAGEDREKDDNTENTSVCQWRKG